MITSIRNDCRIVAYIFFTLLAMNAAQLSSAAETPQSEQDRIRPGAKVFIEKMDGFEDYLAAALHAKKVPVVVVTDRDKADFVISGSAKSSREHEQATIKVVNRSGVMVFAYSFVSVKHSRMDALRSTSSRATGLRVQTSTPSADQQ